MLEYIGYREEMNMSVSLAAKVVVTHPEQAIDDLSPNDANISNEFSVPNILHYDNIIFLIPTVVFFFLISVGDDFDDVVPYAYPSLPFLRPA